MYLKIPLDKVLSATEVIKIWFCNDAVESEREITPLIQHFKTAKLPKFPIHDSGFLRNSRKYGLGSLRKTPHGGHPTHWSRSLVRQSTINPTTNQPFLKDAFKHSKFE